MLNNETVFEPENVNRTDYVEKREIDHSTLYSFNTPFQLLHADIGNLEFLGKNATFQQYFLVMLTCFHQNFTPTQWNQENKLDRNSSSFIEMLKAKEKVKKWDCK